MLIAEAIEIPTVAAVCSITGGVWRSPVLHASVLGDLMKGEGWPQMARQIVLLQRAGVAMSVPAGSAGQAGRLSGRLRELTEDQKNRSVSGPETEPTGGVDSLFLGFVFVALLSAGQERLGPFRGTDRTSQQADGSPRSPPGPLVAR
ncbi:hypothetical protein ACIA8F_24075 [Streptomyces sp. NPDC051563]|uniref:hypothetical protein n=1 Tax=Streptomyces sp. NPDC051563 TaxID=3365659 RepID=UPI0037B47B91